MTYIIIDSDNYAAADIETMFFPGGEPHAKVPKFSNDVLFFLKARTWNDIGLGACVLGALRLDSSHDVRSFIPYFPGARQDKTDGTAPETLAMMVNLFRAGLRDIFTFDVHSEKFFTYTYKPHHYNLMPAFLPLETRDDVVGVIAPDAGAANRSRQFRDRFYPTAALVECSKVRDPRTGRLSNYSCPNLPAKGRYIIVDDICDGGGTFNLLADAFFHAKFGQKCRLDMFVSHGIFSKGLDAIDSRIEHITTTDSWCRSDNNERLTVVPLLPSLLPHLGA